MEQRIGSSSQPLQGAGFDPAFIPGLTSPVTAEPKDAVPQDGPEADGTDTAPDAAEGAPAEVTASAGESKGSREPGPGPEPEDAEATPDGPVFEAADRRARIVADARGVRLRLDEEECEFRWEEIGAIETETPRFGKRFTVTVHTPDRRWYPIEIEATARGRFKEWDEQLDAVLDAYFEEAADRADAASGTGPDAEADAGPDAD
ncbi:hypothetical protein ACF09K_02890 [Streptomyces sp. NPDC014882]|uniref:hypothetical protein n=1 Tax=Streptomyces sp. NPDC014882 TaxID=3364927 RepID=UPI0036F9D45A